MEYTNITQATKKLGLSTRALRYYEQVGLIKSERTNDYAYRVYSEETLTRIRQIIVLRKLRIPLKSISEILTNKDAKKALDIFMKNISEIDTEINALSTIRDILRRLTDKLSESVHLGKKLDFLSDDIIGIADTLTAPKPKIKEEITMSELNQANENLSKLKDVRIVHLPPSTVASFHYIGENPEETVSDVVAKIMKDINLYDIKPDAKMFGFNHPNPSKDRQYHGYEVWITIPDELDIPEPLVKKQYKGGLYAVHTITIPNFHEWGDLDAWVHESEKYTFDLSPEGDEVMCGCLEEHLNWVYHNHLGLPEGISENQLDLHIPVKFKTN
ncbi:MAG: effector binding domain-containing protein [Ruminococcus sp.]|jgi:DNA-binding transcriptional MerR regulator|nr:effector binding domain-containing protein [Ruminococcus sp.]